jgi:hypothetical protein
MEPTLLERNGYGSTFNNLYISGDTIRKESKTPYGYEKITKEIQLLQHIIKNQIPFPIPTILEFGDNFYTMHFLKDHIPLYKIFGSLSPENQDGLLEKIHGKLNSLHSNTYQYNSDRDVHITNLRIETYDKIISRTAVIKDIIEKYSYIKTVNNVALLSLETILSKIQSFVSNYIASLKDITLCAIHGDCQFNNVLYHPVTQDIVFIDPRGYFGNSIVYGIPEYDYAKVTFALSGYDIFDNMEVNDLEIHDDNLVIPNIFLKENIFDTITIVEIFTLSVWLGNAHCFKQNEKKAAFSYFYALYLCSKYLQ